MRSPSASRNSTGKSPGASSSQATRLPSVAFELGSDVAERFSKRLVMIGPRVASDAGQWPVVSGRRVRVIAEVGTGTDHQRLCARHGPARIRRPGRIAEGEMHPTVEILGLSSLEDRPGAGEPLGPGDPHRGPTG